jgi:hypothetical protein
MPYTVVDKGSKYFDTKLYTGTGASLNVTGLNFKPDLTWVKRRDTTGGNKWTDAVRGAGIVLNSNSDSDEFAQTGISTFNSDGFTVGTASGDFNASGGTYASWNWLGANTTASNTSGTITSTVSANTTSGFSIVSYTGAGGASTVGHGLGVAPKVIIIKSRSNSTNWILGHNSLGWNKYITLNLGQGVETNNYFNDTAPTSSLFSIFNSTNVNGSGYTYVAYCFTDIKGYSKFASYTGNGSTDGTFVYTGFKPAFVIYKDTTVGTSNDWVMVDNKRIGYNSSNYRLFPNWTGAENTTGSIIDFLSNGFKFRESDTSSNGSGRTYIYMAFAENPFTSSKGIPCTAR